MVVNLAADTEIESNEADAEVRRESRRIRVRRILFWTTFLALFGFLFFGGLSGALLKKDLADLWTSWIWWLPIAMLILPIGCAAIARDLALERSIARLVFFVISPLVLFFGLLWIILSGFPLPFWGAIVGNATMGQSGFGLWGVINFGLVFIVPTLSFIGVIWVLLQPRFSVIWALFFTVLTPAALVLPLGQSIITNLGW
jgi:hypothetical protein